MCVSGGEAARTRTSGGCEIVALLAGPNWLCGSHDPAGLGTVPGTDPRSVPRKGQRTWCQGQHCLVCDGKGGQSHLINLRGEGWQYEVLRSRNFLTVMRKGATARLTWDVCDSAAAAAARFILRFGHLVQLQVILSRHLQPLREDQNCALTWLHTWPCTEARDPWLSPVRSGRSGRLSAPRSPRPFWPH